MQRVIGKVQNLFWSVFAVFQPVSYLDRLRRAGLI
jgi:hypothetical protein